VDILGKQAAVAATANAVKPRPKETTGTTSIHRLQRGIALENVCYQYGGRPAALDDVSAVFEAGKWSALVGESGSGKSTIVSLLLGFLRPSAGRILVDGSPLEELDLESWRKHFGYVGQDAFLFNTTMGRNITLDRIAADDPRVIDAAAAVGLEEFLRTLPRGYETLVGDRGVQLSGGQRQRIALARAIVLRPEILLLDEAVNALDNESVTRLMKILKSFLPGVTIITVSHRLVATADYDSIVVLREGRLVESGKHSELVQRGGYYSELFELEQLAPVHLDSQ
jgi:ABC-type bacteriocin/lantibiotic exporter with double-glycine peptidase domain